MDRLPSVHSLSTKSTTRRVLWAAPLHSSKSPEVFGDGSLKQPETESAMRNQEQQHNLRSPLVDSLLLRFVGSQKQLQQQLQLLATTECPSNASEIKLLDEETARAKPAVKASTPVLFNEVSDVFAKGLFATNLTSDMTLLEQVSTVTPVDETSDVWFGQYNRYRVAGVLKSKGGRVEESLLLQAGYSVQSQALARTARRRIREFLKERDQVWQPALETSRSLLSTTTSITSQPSTSTDGQGAQNNMEDVVDLLRSFGFSVRDITEILIHSPGIAFMKPRPSLPGDGNGESLQETVDRAFVGLLLKTLRLRKFDARKVLRTCPGLLSKRGSRSAEQIVTLFQQLGVSTRSISRDKNVLPVLLSRSPASVFQLVAFLSSDSVRMPVGNIGPLLRRQEAIPLLDAVAPVPLHSRNSLFPRSDSLQAEGGGVFGSTDQELVDALAGGRANQIRRAKINETYQSMRATAETLRNKIGTADLGRVIAAYPAVLLLGAKTRILPIARYLIHELGIWEDDLPRVLQLYPTLLGLEREQMQDVADYLISLGVQSENLGSIFRAFPALLRIDVESQMVPVVEFLRSIGVIDIGRFVSRLPPVLGYSVDDELRPKWEFFKVVCTDPRFEVSRFPACFSYPLDRVIKTRYEYLRIVKRIPTQLIALDQALRHGDNDFATQVAGDFDVSAFRKFVERRRQNKASRGRNFYRNRQRNVRPLDKPAPKGREEK